MPPMQLDPANPVVKWCIEGMKAEVQGRRADAHACFVQAWHARQNDLDACIAAHYLARQQPAPEDQLRWNQAALDHANALAGTSPEIDVRAFYPSLYLNLGKSHEALGDVHAARRCYEQAAQSLEHSPTELYGEHVRDSIAASLRRTAPTA